MKDSSLWINAPASYSLGTQLREALWKGRVGTWPHQLKQLPQFHSLHWISSFPVILALLPHPVPWGHLLNDLSTQVLSKTLLSQEYSYN